MKHLAWGVSHKISSKWVLLGRYYFGERIHPSVYGGYVIAAFKTKREANEAIEKSVCWYTPRKSFRIKRIEVSVREL